ncbi:EAL domain-containing protein [Blastomonas sp. AAP53]|uniref:putative bifunctional diguanylate cyclase/phosphodiesterase n=1 Tax=Blastomonas sp. AAP53 TaxID=1248760 RepID=UPI001EE68D2F|nr:EAL domain-containing protein [Blastomonas sp. AAP53]
MTLAFEFWCMGIYSSGDAYARGNLTFFLGLTQVSTVFCLMTLRAAAMRVAATSTVCFIIFFSVADQGRMAAEAVVLGCVGVGMMIVTHRYNLDFSNLIRSQRDLRNRQAETEKLSDENRKIALTDALSGLPNRRQLLVNLDRIDARPVDALDGLAVLFIDLDGFKDINDTHGHQAGDSLICSLSVRIREICPPHSMLARVGGDEFVVLIDTPGAAAVAAAMAERISDEIALPVLVDKHVLQVGASIGIATNIGGACTSHELLRRADTAMYHAKTSRKGKIAVYDSALDRGRIRRMEIEAEIGTGLANNEFDVFYQPVVDAQSGQIVATEALIRWPRRPAGVLVPQQFIEIAEATGQIHPLGMFVLERSCRDVLALDNISLSVNVSPAQFRDPGFLRQVAHVLEQTRFPPQRLQLEITEGYLLSQPEAAIRTIKSFKAMGLSIALDDFGTGFTSIHYLRTYGFSHVKIDKSLLAGLSPGSKASFLVAGAINLARGLDMEVTAEGVETHEQATLLRAAGCDKLQGFLFGRPMPFVNLRAMCSAIAHEPRPQPGPPLGRAAG